MSQSDSSVHLPKKRTDGETLEDRLTENAYQRIIPQRYLKKDENGVPTEEPEDLFERVAKNIAVAEAVYTDEDVVIRPEHIKPDHPRRDDLIDEVFFTPKTPTRNDPDPETLADEVELTEENAKWVDYDAIIDDLPDATRNVVEDQKEQFQDRMEYLDFVPNSPCLANAGDELQQLSACFVMSPQDDIADIHDTIRDAALTFQSGGGVGYAFSYLRPYGDTVGSTGGIASGPLTFMRTYDQMCRTIAQGGMRRGAQMGVMRVTHPDVIFFIHSKNKDVSLAQALRLNDPKDYVNTTYGEALDEAREILDEFTDNEGRLAPHLRNAVEAQLANFNISVTVTDDFMEAVQNDELHTFINPRTGHPHIATEETKEMYEWFDLGEHVTVGEPLRVPAREIWEDIIEGAHENGEPGVLFIDTANVDHSFPTESTPTWRDDPFEMSTTNPCCAKGTLVNTPDGYRRVEEIEVGDEVSTVIGSETVDEVEVHEDVPIYRVEFSDGGSMKVTGQHRFHVLKDDKGVDDIPLVDVDIGDHVRLEPASFNEVGTNDEYRHQFRRGVLVGDGCYTQDTLKANNVVKISTSEDDAEYNRRLKALFEDDGYAFNADENSSDDKALRLNLRDGWTVVEDHGLTPSSAPMKTVDVTEFSTEREAMGFLDGLLGADGNVNLWSTRPQVRYDTSSKALAKDVRDLCLQLGMHARIYEVTDPQRGGSINGRKVSSNHPKYTVNISGASAKRFAELSNVGDYHPEKGEQMLELRTSFMNTGDSWKAEVVSIEPCGEPATVYDLYCSRSDTWVTSGYVQRGCGEQWLMENEACNLGHINLSTLVAEDAPDWRDIEAAAVEGGAELDLEHAVSEFLWHKAIDVEDLDARVDDGVRFLDNVVTMSAFPTPEIEQTVSENRKIGLGIMGLAQMFVQLGTKYGSDVSNEITRQLMRHINQRSKDASMRLTDHRGVFDNWEHSKYADPTAHTDWFERQTGEAADVWEDGYLMRNHNTTTVAPTGTTGMIGNTSGGCEPIFGVAHFKNVSQDIQGDEQLVEFDDYFLRVLEANDIDVEATKKECLRQMENNEFEGVHGLKTVPNEIGELFVTTDMLTGREHASVQCAAQEGVDSALSKTVNFPNRATEQDVADVYEYLWDNGAKGGTIYRDGSRSKQVISTRADHGDVADDEPMSREEAEELIDELAEEHAIPLGVEPAEDAAAGGIELVEPGKVLTARRERIKTGYGNMYVNIGFDDEGRPIETICNIGKSGGFTNSMVEAIGKLSSLALQAGVPAEEVVEKLDGISSPDIAFDDGEQIASLPDGIATALQRAIEAEQEATLQINAHNDHNPNNESCPDCGGEVVYDGGCPKCSLGCGWSKC